MGKENYRARESENRTRENDISRRGFIKKLIDYSTTAGLFVAVPGVVSAGLLGREYNQDIESEKERASRLFQERYLADERGEALREERLKKEKLTREIREREERLVREKAEREQAERKALEDLMNKELTYPYKIPYDKSSDRLLLARTIFAEAEGEYKHPEYMKLVGISPIVRAHLSGKSLLDKITEKYISKKGKVSYAYSFLMPGNARYDDFINPVKKTIGYDQRIAAWETAYNTANDLTKSSIDKIDPFVTSFWVDSVSEPTWAEGETPVKTITHKGKTTRFYYIPEMA